MLSYFIFAFFAIDLEKIVNKHKKLKKRRHHAKILNLHFHYDFELRINQMDHVLVLIPYKPDKSAKHKEMTFPNKTQATHNVPKEN